MKTLTNPEIFNLRQKDIGQSRKKQEWTEYTLTTHHTAQANVQDEKGKERNKRRCTMELKILFVLHHLLILKPFMLGNRLKQKENYGQGRRARMAG